MTTNGKQQAAMDAPNILNDITRSYVGTQFTDFVQPVTTADAVSDGWQLVPIKADQDMIHSGASYYRNLGALSPCIPSGIYCAMLKAAPKHTPAQTDATPSISDLKGKCNRKTRNCYLVRGEGKGTCADIHMQNGWDAAIDTVLKLPAQKPAAEDLSAVREALALHHSMVMCRESETTTSEIVYQNALAALKRLEGWE